MVASLSIRTVANSIQDSLRPIIEKFVSELEVVWRSEALRILSASLDKGAAPAAPQSAPKRGKPGPKPGSKRKAAAAPKAPKAAAPKAAKAAKAPAAASSAGGKKRRGKTEIESLANKIVGYVKAHPASRAEQIKQALGITGKYEWLAPIGRLLDSGRLVSTGQKRSTTYSVGK
jgi:hypothetical protein